MPFNGTLASKGCLFNFRQPLAIKRARLGRRIGVQRQAVRIPQNARRCRPTTQAPAKKRIL